MHNNEVVSLVDRYWKQEPYTFPSTIEHRVDPDSSALLYSFLRDRKPKTVVEIGTWEGGSTAIIAAALKKNERGTHYASELMDDLRETTRKIVKEHVGVEPMMLGDITCSLEQFPSTFDGLFVDTNHDLEVTEWIVKNLWPRLDRGGLFVMHDWAVAEKEGVLIGKGDNGKGALPETEYLMELYKKQQFPFKKLYWTYGNPLWEGMSPSWETAFWEKL